MLVTYPDVAYLSVCELVADDLGLSTRASPRSGLLLSGVAPLRWVLHQFGGGVMLPNWCNPPELASCPLVWSCLRYGDSFPTMSHVILLRLLQTLNLHRWNCNVLSGARKMTEGNYVRLFSGRVLWSRCEPGGPILVACCALLGQARLTPAFASPSRRALRAARTCAARRTPQAQRKRGPTTDPRPKRCYSWSPLRPRGVIWGHSRSMFASLPCLRRYFSKSSAQSW